MSPELDPKGQGEGAFAVLRRFARQRPAGERCELCAGDLAADHEHLIEPASRRLLCCCPACALLFSGREGARFRRVPRRVQHLPDFRMTDEQWDGLHIPISLAFFFHSTSAGRVVAAYPSPAGAVESLLPLEAWQELEQGNPNLRKLEPDVEALLINRVGPACESYCVPVDKCYELVGLIRTTWRGLSGGAELWQAIGQFFTGLKAQSGPAGERLDA
jgi:hypothetical protein